MALNNEEKQELARRIAMGVQVVCSSVAQLHLGSPDPNASVTEDVSGIVSSLRSHGNGWKFTNIEGALLLIRDQQGFCYFRIYDLDVFKLRFQYELYENLDYMELNNTFHAFEMENCVCGFNFADEAVAKKFYERVNKYIIRKEPSSVQMSITSPGFQSPPNPGLGKSRKKAASGPADQGVVLLNGTLDPNTVPSEWKKILRKAGIRKRDLKNPRMMDMIREVLAKHNISIDPPEMDDKRLQQYYTPEQITQWKRYNEEMEKYRLDQERYERELEEYEKAQAREAKLKKRMAEQEKAMGYSAGGAEERMRASVQRFQGKKLTNLLPAASQIKQSQQRQQMPRMSVARPLLPALPVIPEDPMMKAARMAEARTSRVMLRADFLKDIKKENFDLKHVSMLPTLKNAGEGAQQGILATLMDRLKEQREALGEDDEDGGESDFSEIDD